MIKRIFYLTIFVSISLILGACGSKDNVNLSEASSINEDDVTSKYYSEMVLMINAFPIYAEKVIADGVKNSTIEEESREYLLLINSLDLIPLSKVDKELDTYVFDFKVDSKLAAEYMLEYSSSRDISDKHDGENYIKKVIKTFEMIEAIGDKYDLK